MCSRSSIVKAIHLSAFVVLTYLFLGTAPALSQDPTHLPLSFATRHWTAAAGLPVDDVNDIAQTTDGYLWLATKGGLVRFDGLRFTVFKAIDHPGLITNNLRRLFADSAGRLWIMTFQQQLILYEDGRFIHMDTSRGLPDLVTRPLIYTRPVYEDSSGTVWVGHMQGVSQYDPTTKQLRPYHPETLQAAVSSMFQDTDGGLWFGTRDGVLWYREQDGGLTAYPTADERFDHIIWQISRDTNGTLWVASEAGPYYLEDNQLKLLKPAGYSLPKVVRFFFNEDQERMWFADMFSLTLYLEGNRLFSVHESSDVAGHPLFPWTTDLKWMARDSLVYYNDQPILNIGSGTRIQAFMTDHEGSYWLGTTSGLFQLRQSLFSVWKRPGSEPTNVFPVLQGPDGTVWAGTLADDLLRISGTTVTSWNQSTGFYIGHPWALHTDRKGQVWVGGFNLCRIEGNRCINLEPPLNEVHGETRVIFEDSDGWFWLGGEHGIVRRKGEGPWETFTDVGDAPNFWTQAIIETADGSVWFGTFGHGLFRYKEGRFSSWTKETGFCTNNVSSLYEDEDHYLWVTTDDSGLCRISDYDVDDLTKAKVVMLGPADGLYESSIHSLVEDDDARFWMTTYKGVFWVPRAQLNAVADGLAEYVASVVYDQRDGILSHEFNTNVQPSSMKDRTGRLWFSSRDGVVMIDPHRLRAQENIPQPIIESILLADSTVAPNTALQLQPEQREIEIEYTAISYVKSSDVRFQYRLLGMEDTWREAGTDRKIRFTNLDPGTYTFQVKATNWFGIGGTDPAEFTFERLPYFYETRLFMALVFLSLVLGIVGVFRYRTHQVRRRNLELEEKVTERTGELKSALTKVAQQAEELQSLDETKSRFFANVSHEFRTPLTLIRGHLQDLESRRFGSKLAYRAKDALSLALTQTERLRILVEQLLALARLQSDETVLRAQRLNLNAFAARQVSFFESLAEKNRISLRYEGLPDALDVYADPTHLEQIITNLVSNALKFTPKEGHVTVTLSAPPEIHQRGTGEFATVTVADSGIGIAPEDLERIFERFYQVDNSATRRYEGTGVGLALVKELVELHGGSIQVESKLNEGTTFTVRFPLGRAHLTDTEILEKDTGDTNTGTASSGTNADQKSITSSSGDGAVPESIHATVLVVEDNPDLRAYLAGHLRDLYDVVEAEDGQAALDLIPNNSFDLIISDVMMPRLDGMSLLQTVKAHAHWQTIPFMLLTARADATDRLRGLEARADDYLAKPFNLTELLVRVRNLIVLRQRMHAQFSQQVVAVEAEALELANEETVFLEQLHQVVMTHISTESFDVIQLAVALNMSRATLLRHIKNLTGLTPAGYMRKLRLEHARQMLEQGRVRTVAEVTVAVGFKDSSYFSRLFRKTYGHSPASLLVTPDEP